MEGLSRLITPYYLSISMGRLRGEKPQGSGVKCDVFTFSLSKFWVETNTKTGETIIQTRKRAAHRRIEGQPWSLVGKIRPRSGRGWEAQVKREHGGVLGTQRGFI